MNARGEAIPVGRPAHHVGRVVAGQVIRVHEIEPRLRRQALEQRRRRRRLDDSSSPCAAPSTRAVVGARTGSARLSRGDPAEARPRCLPRCRARTTACRGRARASAPAAPWPARCRTGISPRSSRLAMPRSKAPTPGRMICRRVATRRIAGDDAVRAGLARHVGDRGKIADAVVDDRHHRLRLAFYPSHVRSRPIPVAAHTLFAQDARQCNEEAR